LRVYADLLPASDGTAPFAIHTFNQITAGARVAPLRAAVASDHFVFTGAEADEKQTSIARELARLHGIGKPHYAAPGDGIFHFYCPEQGLIVPGGFCPGADSHSRAYGAYGAVGIGIGSTTLGFGWATGYIYMSLARQRRMIFAGRLQPWVSGKDIVLELLRRWGEKQAQGMSVEFVDKDRQLAMPYRNTIANMMAEAEAQNGIFTRDEITDAWYRERNIPLPYPRLTSGAEARGEIRQSWCGPCFGQGDDALKPGERAITSFNRNWQNRMGVGGEGYLASPAVVAASALAGYMAPPSEIGLRWNPEWFAV